MLPRGVNARALLFALGVVCPIYFVTSMHLTCSNDGSQFALVSAMAERGSVRIDDFVAYTKNVDFCFKDGAYYSDRPPGLALLSLPLYELGKELRDRGWASPFTGDANPPEIFVMLLPNLAAALSCWLVFVMSRRLGCGTLASACSSIVFAFATPAWIEATRFFSHGASMALVFGAACLAAKPIRIDGGDKGAFAGVVALLALASITEIQNVLLVVPFLAYLLSPTGRPSDRRAFWTRLSLALAGFLLIYSLLPLYNFAKFHEWTIKCNKYNPTCPQEQTLLSALSGNPFQGLDKLFASFSSPRAVFHWAGNVNNQTPGLFVLCPVLLVSCAGWLEFFRAHRREALLFLSVIAVETAVASFHLIPVVRHVSTIVPFLFLPAGFVIREALEKRRWAATAAVAALAALSAARVFYVLNNGFGRMPDRPFLYARQLPCLLLVYGIVLAACLLLRPLRPAVR